MRFSTLFFCLATTVSAASFSTDGVIVSNAVTETMMVTISGDTPVSYDLSVEVIFDLDDTDDTASISGFNTQTMPDLPPITRTTMTTRFIPGDFPNPGHYVDVTTIVTVDVGAAPTPMFGSHGFSYPIREDSNGFFFDYLVEGQFQISGLLTESISIDGGPPTIDTNLISVGVSLGSDIRIRINPDLSLSLESGSFLGGNRIGGIPFTIVVPEPTSWFLALWAMAFTRMCMWRKL